MKDKRLLASLLAIALATCSLSVASAAAPPEDEIDQLIERAMDAFEIPGMAVSVVYDGEVYYSKGHGLV